MESESTINHFVFDKQVEPSISVFGRNDRPWKRIVPRNTWFTDKNR